MADIARPNVRQRRVARTLREWRKSTGATMEEVAQKLRWSQPKLSRFERADVIAGPAEIIALATILGVEEDERDATVALAMSSVASTGWWNSYNPESPKGDFPDYLGTEAEAELVNNVETMMIPGLLQTVRYAEALFQSWSKNSDTQQIAERSKVRQRRQSRLHDEHPLKFHTIIHECALRQYIGNQEIMREQLAYLIQTAKLPNIQLQVIPISSGAYAGFGISYHLVSFKENDPAAVYLDHLKGGTFVEEASEVNAYVSNFEYLSDFALGNRESIQLIEQVLRHGSQEL